jgi:vacuolar-type H+-ATPase subunit I/STV1
MPELRHQQVARNRIVHDFRSYEHSQELKQQEEAFLLAEIQLENLTIQLRHLQERTKALSSQSSRIIATQSLGLPKQDHFNLNQQMQLDRKNLRRQALDRLNLAKLRKRNLNS